METIEIKDEYIELGQLLKLSGLVDSGLEAKIVINNGEVSLNGVKELQRGKKIKDGDIVDFRGNQIRVKAGL
ncbi:MAG: RNA-binding S4 domain-containing protein [Lachnospiraceae bacterium]|nr:RNA-binding S4 domain-containing protein [Lachnospiraceae bacterium]